MVGFLLVSGIPAEDFLCVPEPDEDECLSSGLDGDATSHKQVSVEGPRPSIHGVVLRLRRACLCKRKPGRGQDHGHGDREERVNVKKMF